MKGPIGKAQYDNIIGKKVKIITTAGSHNVPKGTIVTITHGNFGTSPSFHHDYGNNSILKLGNIELVAQTKEELGKELKKLRASFKKTETELKNKIKFLEETNSEAYDDNAFKVYVTLTALEDTKTSKIEKAKLIASLIEGNI